jgi:hypothetical protein
MMATFSLLALLAILDMLSMRRVHWATALGGAWVVVIELTAIGVGHAAAWQHFATRMHSLGG